MAREKKPVHKVQMTDGKRNIIHQLLQEYDIQFSRRHSGCPEGSAWRYHQRNDGNRDG